MTNDLGYFNPDFFAPQLLMRLEAYLGMVNRIYRGYEVSRNTQGNSEGETIKIKGPSTFESRAAPAAPQDLKTKTVDLKLNNWREVRYEITDQEIAYTGDQIIAQHVDPMAYTLAEYIDQQCQKLFLEVPHFYNADTGGAEGAWKKNLTGVRKVLVNNRVNFRNAANMHFQMEGEAEEGLLNEPAFSQDQGSGGIGVNTQLTGNLGFRYGMNTYTNQIHESFTIGDATGVTLTGGSGLTGARTIQVNVTSGSFNVGDSILIAGDPKPYAVTEASSGPNLKIEPPLRTDLGDGAITYATGGGASAGAQGDASIINAAFHSEFATVAFARLPENNPGIQTRVVSDPATGVAVRMFVGTDIANSSKIVVGDVLFGTKTLNVDAACRLHQP